MKSTPTGEPGTGRASPPERTIYEIRDADGRLVAEKIREDRGPDEKECFWRLPGAKDWGLNGIKLEALPLYGAELIADLGEDEAIVLVEGEKARDALEAAGIPAVGTVTGAATTPGREALEVLSDREVTLWADTDEQGRKHMERIGEALQGVAAEVRRFEWTDAPQVPLPNGKLKAQDAADHPAVQSKDPDAVDRLLNDLLSARRWEPNKPAGLPFKTAKALGQETPAEVPWRVRPWLADGAITEIDGRVKWSGKTTFALHMLTAPLDGKPFMGQPTQKSGVVFLTEQGDTSFLEALEDAGLLDREDLVILRYADVIGVPWPEVAKAAVDKALELGYKILAVDTIGQFAGLKGDAENNAGAALEAMRPLQEAAAKGLAVLFTRHERKSGGDVGTSGRGSSAYSGAVDLIISLRRAEGNVRETARKIETLSRFKETPTTLMIEKTDQGYVSLGSETAVEKNSARERVLRAAPLAEHEAMTKAKILEEASVKYHTGHTVLVELVNEGELRRKGEGKKGDPHRFWRPDPPGGDEGKKRSVEHISNVYQQKESFEEIHSVDTPLGSDTKNSGPHGIRSVETNTVYTTERISLTVPKIAEELRRAAAGPALALANYLASPNPKRLEYLTKAVLTAKGRDTASWEIHAAAVEEAAKDPGNHPLDCECEGCS